VGYPALGGQLSDGRGPRYWSGIQDHDASIRNARTMEARPRVSEFPGTRNRQHPVCRRSRARRAKVRRAP
jgi:hypothetical protein